MPRKPNPVPSITRHAGRDLVRVRLDGRDVYFGKWDDPAAHERAKRAIAEHLMGQALPAAEHAAKTPRGISITELVVAYVGFAEQYYVKDGRQTNEVGVIKDTLRLLREHYGSLPVAEFGPLKLEAVREAMVLKKWTRTSINARVHRIRRMFTWAVAKQLVKPDVLLALKAVPGLRRGRTTAEESEPVRPVAAETVNATLPFLTSVVRGMVLFQAATGARPGEVCLLRSCDVDRDGEVWIYRPSSHKTQHHGHKRVIFIGPKGQRALMPFLDKLPADAFVFSPAASEAERRAMMHAARKTPLSCGNRPGSSRKAEPKWSVGEQYDHASYRRAIGYAVKRANKARLSEDEEATLIPIWSPNQLRHLAATVIRKEFGLEASQVALGHASADVTQVYAERDMELAKRVALAIG